MFVDVNCPRYTIYVGPHLLENDTSTSDLIRPLSDLLPLLGGEMELCIFTDSCALVLCVFIFTVLTFTVIFLV